jgi:Mor family transcriptional regulator
MLAARDELIWREFNGRNYAELARRHGLTEMRVRQIVAEQRARDVQQRQGRLPGLDDQ